MIRSSRSYLYLVAALFLALLLAGCDQQSPEPFSVEVRVETQQGEPVEGASVGVRPCYGSGSEAACGGNALFQGTLASQSTKPVELVAWARSRSPRPSSSS